MKAKDYRRIALSNVKVNWLLAIAAGVIAWFLGATLVNAAANISFEFRGEQITIPSLLPWIVSSLKLGTILTIVQVVVGGVVRQGYAIFLLKQHDRQELDLKDLFSQFSNFKQGFVLRLLQGLYTVLWYLLLIIPGIVATFKYAMAPFILAENPDMTPSEAITASKEMMDGHKWELFCLNFSFIGWELLASLTLGVGALFLIPYMNAAYAAFYREISAHPAELPEAEVVDL